MANAPISIGRYQIVKSIGHGGMGSLYLAWDKDLERQIVIKVLKEDDDELRARFSREAKSAARLKHAHIVTIFELGEHEGQPYIAMEYIEGPTLAEVIAGRDQPPLPRKLELVSQLCDGLGYAHKAGVVHRDIKPANIMIHKDGDLKILDFGVARIAESASMTQAGMMIGTLNYMSPEQVSGESIDHRSDIFAVGTVFYEFLTLKKAFPGTISSGVLGKILHGEPEKLRDALPGIDDEVVRIVGRAIEKKIDNRYPDLEQMRRDLIAVQKRLEEQSDATQIIDLSTRARAAATSSGTVRRSTARDDLDRRRASQVQYYLELAERGMSESRYDSVIAACEQALLLDAENARALELVELARTESDVQQSQQLLSDAERELQRGALTLASDLAEQAGALRASPEHSRLRQAIDRAIEQREQATKRADAVRSAMQRAQTAFDTAVFADAIRFADEALALEPTHAAAAALKAKAAESQARAARDAAEQRAREAILEARQRFAKGDHSGATSLLEGFSPPHDAVSRTLTELVTEAGRIAAQRKRESEARAKQQRIAGVLALAREELRDQRFSAALERLQVLEAAEGATPEISDLLRQVRDSEAAQRKAQAEADRLADQRRRDADAQARQQRIADVVAQARADLQAGQFAAGIERLSVLERVEGKAPEITRLTQELKDGESAHRRAQEEAARTAERQRREAENAEAARRKAQEAADRKAQEAERKAREAASQEQSPTVIMDRSQPAPGPIPVPRPKPDPVPDHKARVDPPKPPAAKFNMAAVAGVAALLALGIGGYVMFGGGGGGGGTTTTATTTSTAESTTTTTAPVVDNRGGKPDLARAESLAREGQTLLGQSRLIEAGAKFRESQGIAPTALATSGVAAIERRRDDYRQRWAEAERERGAGNFRAASAGYSGAKQSDPEAFAKAGGEDRLADVQKRMTDADKAAADAAERDRLRKLADAARAESASLVKEGRTLAAQGRHDEADAKFASALQLDKDNAEASSALARSQQYKQAKARAESSNQSGNLPAAQQAYEEAKAVDAGRFNADGLEKSLADVKQRQVKDKPPPPPVVDESPAVQARIQAFARAISSDTNPGRDNSLVSSIYPKAPPYFRIRQYQHFEFTGLEFSFRTVSGIPTATVRATQVQQYGANGPTNKTTGRAEIVLEKRNGVWLIIDLQVK